MSGHQRRRGRRYRVVQDSARVILSNVIVMAVSIGVALVLPKILGVTGYGYWQLYQLYALYVGLSAFGAVDGIYLKLGGVHYDTMDQTSVGAQGMLTVLWQCAVAVALNVGAVLFMEPGEGRTVLHALSVTMVLTNVKWFYLYVLQATNRMKEYARAAAGDRLIFLGVIVIAIAAGYDNFRYAILADLIGRTGSLVMTLVACRGLVRAYPVRLLRGIWPEYRHTVRAGNGLLLSNLASRFITGVIRIIIERRWSIEVFSKVSLTVTLANFAMTFFTAISTVLFPTLRRTPPERLGGIYTALRAVLTATMFLALFLYFPLRPLMEAWLPDYADSMQYLALLFPVAVFEAKVAMLSDTYMKSLRMEVLMLRVNVVVLVAAGALGALTAWGLDSLDLTVLLLVVVIAARSAAMELALDRRLRLGLLTRVLSEVGLAAVFMVATWFLVPWAALVAYAVAAALYLVAYSRDLRRGIAFMRGRPGEEVARV